MNRELKPALTQDQLERQVADVVKQNSGNVPDSISCESGLEGDTGNIARCDVDYGGVTVRHTVRVTKVENLQMSFVLLQS